MLPLDDYLTSDGHIDSPESATESLEERERLLLSIHELPAERQELLILKFVERMSNAEIGKIMDRTEGAIKSLYHRTLLSLRSTLEDDDNSDGKSGRRLFGL